MRNYEEVFKMENEKKQVEYGDYVFMSCDEEDKDCISNDIIKDMSVTFMEYFEYMLNDEFRSIEDHILKSLQLKNWCNYNDDDIIDSILAKTDMERKRKKQKKDYYIANGKCSLNMLKFIFTKELYNALKQSPRLIKHNYYHILILPT